MLWIVSTSGCCAFVFQEPIGIGLKIQVVGKGEFYARDTGTQ